MCPQLQLIYLQTTSPIVLLAEGYGTDLATLSLTELVNQGWQAFDHGHLLAASLHFVELGTRSKVQREAYFAEMAENSLQFLASELAQQQDCQPQNATEENDVEVTPENISVPPAQTIAADPVDPEIPLGTCRLEGQVHLREALFCHRRGQFTPALRHLEAALSRFTSVQDLAGVGHSLSLLGQVYLAQGQAGRALAYCQAATAILSDLNTHPEQGPALQHLGLAHLQKGDFKQAKAALEAALTYFHQQGEILAEGTTLVYLGRVYLHQREFMFALACYEGALDSYLSLSSDQHPKALIAQVLGWIGRLYADTGRSELAIAPYWDALKRYRDLGLWDKVRDLFRRLGRLYETQQRFTIALECYQQSLQGMAPAALPRLRS